MGHAPSDRQSGSPAVERIADSREGWIWQVGVSESDGEYGVYGLVLEIALTPLSVWMLSHDTAARDLNPVTLQAVHPG